VAKIKDWIGSGNPRKPFSATAAPEAAGFFLAVVRAPAPLCAPCSGVEGLPLVPGLLGNCVGVIWLTGFFSCETTLCAGVIAGDGSEFAAAALEPFSAARAELLPGCRPHPVPPQPLVDSLAPTVTTTRRVDLLSVEPTVRRAYGTDKIALVARFAPPVRSSCHRQPLEAWRKSNGRFRSSQRMYGGDWAMAVAALPARSPRLCSNSRVYTRLRHPILLLDQIASVCKEGRLSADAGDLTASVLKI